MVKAKSLFYFFHKDREESKVKEFQFLQHFHTDNGLVQLQDLEMLRAQEVKVKKKQILHYYSAEGNLLLPMYF